MYNTLHVSALFSHLQNNVMASKGYVVWKNRYLLNFLFKISTRKFVTKLITFNISKLILYLELNIHKK